MSFEVLEQLEAKIQTAVDTIALLQMEVEELKEEKQALATEAGELKASRHELEQKLSKCRKSILHGKIASVTFLVKWMT